MKKDFKTSLAKISPAPVIIIISFLAVIIFSFTACINAKKVQRWNDDHPELEAKNCFQKYPARPGDTTVSNTVDSFDYSRDLFDVNEYINVLNSINDSLAAVLQLKDTACNKYVSALQKQKMQILKLQDKASNMRPLIIHNDTVFRKLDSAALHGFRLENSRLLGEIENNEKDLASSKSVAKIRMWMLIASCILNVLLIVLLFKKKSNPVINAVT